MSEYNKPAETMTVLLIDIGNSRIKYTWANASEIATTIHLVQDVDSLTPALLRATCVILSCVNRDDYAQHIINACQQRSIPVQVAATEKQAVLHCTAGVAVLRNSYVNIDKMGCDRWLAMCGALAIAHAKGLPAVLVVDAGTAITCDVVVHGQHKGGFIAPGYHTLKQALLQHTTRVFADEESPDKLTLGTDTEACVAMGCLAQLQGTVEAAKKLTEQYVEDYLLVISGGDALLLTGIKDSQTQEIENVVLYGLWARYACKAQ